MEFFKSSLVAFFIVLFCIWLLRPLAIRIGFVDRPNSRKRHEKDVPLIGGIALFFAFCFTLLTLPSSLLPYRSLLAASSILILMGVVDDFKDLSSKLRLFGQLFAALLMVVWGDVTLTHWGNLFFMGAVNAGHWVVPITMLMVVANLNAMNMIDGQDGLIGMVALGQVVLLLFLSMQLGAMDEFRLLFILAILLVVFLAFNMRFPWRHHASIFMGDSGSTFIAFLLSWFAIHLSQLNVDLVKPITVLWIMSFPIFDLINVIIFRLQHRKSILVASRDHLHHLLQTMGMSIARSTLLLSGISFFLGVGGISLNYLGIPEAWQFIIWLMALGWYVYVGWRLHYVNSIHGQ